MKALTAATIALVAIASAAAQDSHSHSSECTAKFLTAARNACDSVADVSQLKCDSEACHEALHSLVEDEVRECYVELGLGPVTDLDYYVQLEEFCHGDATRAAQPPAPPLWAIMTMTMTTTIHDHDHEETAASNSSASGSNAAQSLGASLVALQLVALVAMGLHA
uniref:Elicitin-like protein n=1 Tax=Phytophthora ramorum TaxID=164328 RepID=H3GQP7_PHYRM